jgi:uncharacterized protein DUF4326
MPKPSCDPGLPRRNEQLAMPARIQLKRTRGWRLPPNTVKVDRSTPYGNPYRISPTLDRKSAISAFRVYLAERLAADPGFLEPLRGKNLACWCAPGELCHADVLIEFADPKHKQ